MRRAPAPVIIAVVLAKIAFLSYHLSEDHSRSSDSAVEAFSEAADSSSTDSNYADVSNDPAVAFSPPDLTERSVTHSERADAGSSFTHMSGFDSSTSPNASESLANSYGGTGSVVSNPFASASGTPVRNEFVSTDKPASTSAPADRTIRSPAVNREWLEGDDDTRRRLQSLESNAAPPLRLSDWHNSQPLDLNKMQGKVVVLDFWATWCGPCIQQIDENNELYQRFRNRDVVFVGVCNPEGAGNMAAVISQYGIQYPCAVDPGKTAIKAFRVNGYPDYYIVDQQGRVRFADIQGSHVADAIEQLLEEN